MRVTVASLLNKTSLKELCIIAGHNGENREVKAVSVLDAPDSYKWLKGGELVLTSGFLFGGDDWQFEHFVKNLIEANSSALGVKKDRFVREIPKRVIDMAENSGFPIIEIPYHFSWTDINVAFYCADEKDAEPYEKNIKRHEPTTQEQFYYDFLCRLMTESTTFDDIRKIEEYHSSGKTIYVGAMLIISKNYKNIVNNIMELLDSLHLSSVGRLRFYVAQPNDNAAAAALLEFTPQDSKASDCWQYILIQKLEGCTDKSKNDIIAIGGFCTKAEDISRSYKEAKHAYEIGQALWRNRGCYFFPLLSLSGVLRQTGVEKMNFSCLRLLESIQHKVSFDAVATVEAYIENGNIKDAAAKLCIHTNSLRYRLNKIERTLHLDLDDAMIRNALLAQIKCRKLMNSPS